LILDRINRNITTFNRETEKQPIKVAIGMKTCHENEDLDEIIQEADKQMFAAKRKMK